jgi:hypothetical protein
VEFPPRKQNTFTNGDSKTAGGGFQYSTMLVQKTVRLWGISLAAGNTEIVTIEVWLQRIHFFLHARSRAVAAKSFVSRRCSKFQN